MDWKGKLEIEAWQFGRLNIVPYIPYTFTVETYVRLDEHLRSWKEVQVTWVDLISTGEECPQIELPPLVNISRLEDYTQIFPTYKLHCQQVGYIDEYEIESIEWQLDLEDVSDFSVRTGEVPLLNYYDNQLWALLNNEARSRLQVGEEIPIIVKYGIKSPAQTLIIEVPILLDVILADTQLRYDPVQF